MRVLSVHADVIVGVSALWQTTWTAVRSGDEGFLIDSPVLPEELEALPELLEQVGFPVSGLLVTHADWDHVLGRLAFPAASVGCAESTAARLSAEPGEVQRGLRRFDEEHYVDGRAPLGLGAVQPLPVPGGLGLGAEYELALHPAGGHTADGMSVWIPWAGALVCGDYLSPVEIPMLSEGGSFEAYLSTLERLEPIVSETQTVIPGHGQPLDRDHALRVLEQDTAYLRALAQDGSAAALPEGRRTHEQRRIHERNAQLVAATASPS